MRAHSDNFDRFGPRGAVVPVRTRGVGTSPAAGMASDAAAGESSDDVAWRRALEKKLRQISDLKRKRDEGGEGALNEEQRQKLRREDELQAKLSLLGAEPGGSGAPGSSLGGVQVGSRLRIDGRRAKVKRVEGEKVRVRFKDDGSKEWLVLASDAGRMSDVRPPKKKGGEPLPPAAATMPSTSVAPLAPRRVAASATASYSGSAALAGGPVCNHCGRVGHSPRVCSYGLRDDETFLLCSGGPSAHPCFPRTFILPLRRATAAFDSDPATFRSGRIDVGLRCVSAALFRSQSLRQNTQVCLCFASSEPDAAPARRGAGGGLNVAASNPAASPRLVHVHGAFVRDLRPDEASLARRIRAVSDASGAATARAAAAAAALEEREAGARGAPVPDDGPLGSWSRGELRGFSSVEGDTLDAVRRAIAQPGAPPMLMVLAAGGEFIGDLCTRIAARGPANPLSGVVVLLGDDRGLTEREEEQLLSLAAARGSEVCRVSLGEDILFASHSIVLVHHYLDRALHSCFVRPPRLLVRGGGGGRGGHSPGRGRGRAGQRGKGGK